MGFVEDPSRSTGGVLVRPPRNYRRRISSPRPTESGLPPGFTPTNLPLTASLHLLTTIDACNVAVVPPHTDIMYPSRALRAFRPTLRMMRPVPVSYGGPLMNCR